MARNRGPSKGGAKVGFWEFLRDVLIASMNKGQFPAALIAMVVLSAIWRMPPADVSKLMFRFLDVAEEEHLVGTWCLLLRCSAGSFTLGINVS